MKGISKLTIITACLIAGIVSSFCFLRIGKRFLVDWLDFRMVVIIAAGILLTAVANAFYLGFRKSLAPSRSSAILAFWQGVIRYSIALDLTMIGCQKLFRLQFSTPLGRLDMPFNSFSPEDLTWAYFGQSRVFVCIIGGIQILGSFLLLFSRTRLVGVFVLLPVMLNIILLNACYHMEWGESIQAIELMIALCYLLFCEYPRLVDFFFRAKADVPSIRVQSRLLRSIVRLSVPAIPLLLIGHYGSPDKNPWLTGRYSVSHLQINRQDVKANSCSDSVLTLVYFDQGNDCVFEYNSQQRRLIGSYRLDHTRSHLTVVWRYPKNVHDTLMATLSTPGAQNKYLIGKMGKDSLRIELSKTP
jgi:hypothetical protein